VEHISGELLSAAVAVVGGVGLSGLAHAWIRHRTRLQVERERSARAVARAASLSRIARRHETVLIDEKDRDGHRVVEMRGSTDAAREEAA
jgi:hypothetical protein